MFERRGARPLPFPLFLRRVALHGVLAGTVVLGSLGLGMVGYRVTEGLSWLDGFLNAAMLLGGMGPIDMPRTEAGKLFAGGYALYSGLVFLIVAGVMFAPLVHRMLHRFHWADDTGEGEGA